ncbi:DinB family protein [Niveibacterium sp. 24ML]|uniref:DinB family protein n=1 Tax=Niveibacterium sp. 24ML TaxID=2985512 RepID=UPI0022721A7C|nr:DinB family protein [Niveibacterium sp. 24ML]MCX9155334.1 DinB family protein [Niveibacterium sp. 24ML]
MPQFLDRALQGLSPELLAASTLYDKSPLLEHLWHVRDCDTDLYGMRIHRILNESLPRLDPVEVGLWPEQRNYLSRGSEQALREFASYRASLIATLRAADTATLARCGVRADGTQINVLGVLEQLLDHDRDHRERIGATLRGMLAAATQGAWPVA